MYDSSQMNSEEDLSLVLNKSKREKKSFAQASLSATNAIPTYCCFTHCKVLGRQVPPAHQKC